MKFQKYDKDLEYSYTLGFFPTIELVVYQPKQVIKVIFSKKAEKSKAFLDLIDECKQKNIPIELDERQVEKLAQKDNTYVVGIFKKYEQSLQKSENHVLLYKPADIGNMGMIIRSALAFNIQNIGIISPGVDCFNPKVIRASMGAFFNCNIQYFASLDEYVNLFKNKLYIFDIKGEKFLHESKITKPFTFFFGTEGDGLPDKLLQYGEVTKIPYESSQVESLNLANSVSIALYQAYVFSR